MGSHKKRKRSRRSSEEDHSSASEGSSSPRKSHKKSSKRHKREKRHRSDSESDSSSDSYSDSSDSGRGRDARKHKHKRRKKHKSSKHKHKKSSKHRSRRKDRGRSRSPSPIRFLAGRKIDARDIKDAHALIQDLVSRFPESKQDFFHLLTNIDTKEPVMVDGIEEEYLRGKLRKLFALMGLSKSEVSSSHPSVYYKAADHTPSLVDEFKDLLATHGTADGTGTGTSHCEDGKTLGSSASTPAVMPAVTGPIGPVGPPAKTASPTTSEAEAAPAPTMSAAAPGPAGPAGPAMPAHLMKGSSGAEASVQTNNDQDGASGHTNSRGRREENSREGDGASNDDDASVSSKRAPKGPYKPSADEIKEIMRQREEKEKEEREEEMGFGPIIPGRENAQEARVMQKLREARALALMAKQQSKQEKAGQADNTREEWMTILPSGMSLGQNAASSMKNRTFLKRSISSNPKDKDSSSWTDTPGEKRSKALEEMILRQAEEESRVVMGGEDGGRGTMTEEEYLEYLQKESKNSSVEAARAYERKRLGIASDDEGAGGGSHGSSSSSSGSSSDSDSSDGSDDGGRKRKKKGKKKSKGKSSSSSSGGGGADGRQKSMLEVHREHMAAEEKKKKKKEKKRRKKEKKKEKKRLKKGKSKKSKGKGKGKGEEEKFDPLAKYRNANPFTWDRDAVMGLRRQKNDKEIQNQLREASSLMSRFG